MENLITVFCTIVYLFVQKNYSFTFQISPGVSTAQRRAEVEVSVGDGRSEFVFLSCGISLS